MSEGLFGDRIRDEVRDIEEHIEERFEEGLFLGLHGKRKRELTSRPSLGGRVMRAIPRLPGFRWYAENVAPKHLHLEEVTVPLPNLPAGLAGLRVGFLTDCHHDLGRPVALLEKGVALLNEARPDVIALGGDYVVKRAAGFDACTAVLARLRAPLGVYAILGNHDYWASSNLIAEKLAAVGLTVLRNRARRLVAPGGAPFWIAGLDDACRLRADLNITLAGVPRDEFRILLAHEPEVADRVGGHRVDLQLSGHSHGGQVVLPFVGPPLLPRLGRRYVRGLYRTPTHTLYTSRGVGGVPPYIRLNCPPEVTVLTLAPRA